MIKLLCILLVAIMLGLVKLRGLVIYLDLSNDSTRKHVVGFYLQGNQTTIDHTCLTWDIQTKIVYHNCLSNGLGQPYIGTAMQLFHVKEIKSVGSRPSL